MRVKRKRQTKSIYKKEYLEQHNSPCATPSSAHVRISVRIPKGIVTSLTIKKNIIAIWLLFRTPLSTDKEMVIDLIENKEEIGNNTIPDMINSFVHSCLDEWDKNTGKGLSDYITEKMIGELLEENDHIIYRTLMGLIKA